MLLTLLSLGGFSCNFWFSIFLIHYTWLTLRNLTGAYFTVVGLHFFLECLIFHHGIFVMNEVEILSWWLFYFEYRVENYLLVTQSSKRNLTVVSWLYRHIVFGPVKLSVCNWETFARKVKYYFTESDFSVFLKLRYID